MNMNDPHRPETEVIIGAAFEVANVLGHGMLEKPYENEMCVELGLRGVPFEQQRRFDIRYKGVHVGLYIPDLIAHWLIVVETKVVDAITDQDLGQMLNHLRVTGLPVGLILNFKRPRLEYRRVVLSENMR
jgi:GxxExxY protein